MKIISILLFFLISLKAFVVEAFDVNNYIKSFDNKYSYEIKAKRYFENWDVLKKKYKFINRKIVISDSKFYQNGKIYSENLEIDFKKSFRVDDRVHLLDVTFVDGNYIAKSKECGIILGKSLLRCKHTKFYLEQEVKVTKLGYEKKI